MMTFGFYVACLFAFVAAFWVMSGPLVAGLVTCLVLAKL